MRDWLDEIIDRHTESLPATESEGQPSPEKPVEQPKGSPELETLKWIPQSFDDRAHRNYMKNLKRDG